MGPLCFVREDKNTPVCGIHHVKLEEREIPIDQDAPYLGRINCFVCPVSEKVVPDLPTRR